jgi:hypothetical protein
MSSSSSASTNSTAMRDGNRNKEQCCVRLISPSSPLGVYETARVYCICYVYTVHMYRCCAVSHVRDNSQT